MNSSTKPLVLVILDGWGHRLETAHNAIHQANTPHFDAWYKSYCHGLIDTSGQAVGLPEGQMGNSEVGHMHIGAGRLVHQDYSRINQAIDNGTFYDNPLFIEAAAYAKQHNKAIHIMGLLSDGGVHSHQRHFDALLQCMHQNQASDRCYVHAFLDGRDTPPQSALHAIEFIESSLSHWGGHLASLSGRYYAMDRDKRWQRTQSCYDLLCTEQASDVSAESAILKSYEAGVSDEFVLPTALKDFAAIRAGDVVMFLNFRADRARQLTQALVTPDFAAFPRPNWPQPGRFISLTQYSESLPTQVAFPPAELKNTLGEVLAQQNLSQLRIAETEKYPHVTFFFNGGQEQAFDKEQRILIPSPPVKTYDLMPCMSAVELTKQLIEQIESQSFDVIICNYANADMVGHTGNMAATIEAIECLDTCLGKVYHSLKVKGGEMLITADHGNAEMMFDEQRQQAHTAHTNGPVPFLYIGRDAQPTPIQGSLIDIAPTLLYLLGLNAPPEMQGRRLLNLTHE